MKLIDRRLHRREIAPALRTPGRVVTQATRQLARAVDRFDSAPQKPAAPRISDLDFVTGLYRDLLGRAPDSAGLAAHLKGLSTGATRDQVLQVFLHSDEFRAKGAAPATPAAPSTPAAPQPTQRDAYKQLIAADFKTAYGREPTDTDFAYWLSKLEGPNDSGFVTSGQMSATEYWHRRMLGWQAGGADVATAGPYAGGGEANGPVPSAADVMSGAPVAPVSVPATSSRSRSDAFKALIDADMMAAQGRHADESDESYWLPKLLGDCDSGFVTSGQMTGTEYWHRRMLGWQAGGADVAKFGPYAGAGEAQGPVPSPEDMVGPIPAR